MRVTVRTVPESIEESADIQVHKITSEVELAARILDAHKGTLIGSLNGEKYILDPKRIYYFETVDDRTFAYTEKETYLLNKRIYELENELDARFFRSSKSLIINISMITSVKSEMNGRMLATLINGEKLIVSRGYVKELKRRLGL